MYHRGGMFVCARVGVCLDDSASLWRLATRVFLFDVGTLLLLCVAYIHHSAFVLGPLLKTGNSCFFKGNEVTLISRFVCIPRVITTLSFYFILSMIIMSHVKCVVPLVFYKTSKKYHVRGVILSKTQILRIRVVMKKK